MFSLSVRDENLDLRRFRGLGWEGGDATVVHRSPCPW